MKTIIRLTKIKLIMLRRRLCLLLAMAAAFAMLSILIVEGISSLTMRDSGIAEISIAVVGHNDENETLVSLASSMTDIDEYSNFVALDYEEAMIALEKGEVFAVIELPENVLNSILSGENSPIYLHLSSAKPTESLITLYAGECATDMLSAAQGAIYAVLDKLKEEGLYNESSVVDVNFDFITFALGRATMYEEEIVSVAGTVSISEHYMQVVLIFVLLMSTAILYPALSSQQNAWQTRLLSIGLSKKIPTIANLLTTLIVILPICAIVYVLSGEFSTLGVIYTALFVSGFAVLLCSICSSESVASSTVFAISGAMLFLSGGIIPPILMPSALEPITAFIPTTWIINSLRGEHSLAILVLGIAMIGFSFVKKSSTLIKGGIS